MATVIVKQRAPKTVVISNGPTGHPYNPTSIAPNNGPASGGTAITCTGTNFTGATGLLINGLNCASFVVVNSTTITAVTPLGAAGPATVFVAGPSGCNNVTGLWTYNTVSLPIVTAIVPSIGFFDGGDVVTIQVASSTGCTGASVNGVALAAFAIVDATHVSGKTGTMARGTNQAVAVTNAAGTGSANLWETFDPTSLPNGGSAVLYYTARHCTNGGNGTPVTAVPDSSGHTNTGVVGGSPTFTAANGSYNGYPTMTFSGASAFLSSTNAGGITTGARTVCYVGHGSNTPNNCYLVSDSQTRDEMLFVDATPGLQITSDSGGTSLAGRTRASTPSVSVCVFTGTASAKLYDTEQTPSTGSAGAIPDLTGSTFRFGNRGLGPVANTSQNGPMFEAAVYASALVAGDAQYLEVGYGKIITATIGP